MIMLRLLLSQPHTSLFSRKIALLLTMALLLSGCAFHLRSHQTNSEIKNIYVSASDQYSPLANHFRRELKHAGIQVREKPDNAQLTLKIDNSQLKHATPTIGTSSQSRVFHFTYTVNFSLFDAHQNTILKHQTLTTRTHLTLSPGQVLTTNNQLDIVKNEMERELIIQFFQRLNSPHVLKQLNENLPQPTHRTA